MAGSFLYIIAPVATGTRRSHGLRSNFDDRAVVNAVVSIDAAEGERNPAVRKMSSVMVNAGTVVMVIYLICVKRGVPQSEEARTVVSESGDILSPKYAPESMAPAVHPSLKPSALPMPIRATPMVATVVHELPVITETMALMRQLVMRKTWGLMICMP